MLDRTKICVIGLGYVGLPLALEFGKKFNTIGYDVNHKRIEELNKNHDSNLEFSEKLITRSKKLVFTKDEKKIKSANFIIICTPTPIKKNNLPDLSLLINATKTVSKNLSKNTIIVYESTVYPGTTNEVCIPLIEKFSKLKFEKDFFVGYSPERINPGDKTHSLRNITKIVSSDNRYSLNKIASVYENIIDAGLYKIQNIKTAESAKIIENIQRDINIALFNELSMIFNKLEINFHEVIEAASTKWNFIRFKPGLVGGHCIGVDPYYLAFKAREAGIYPKLILSGRSINNYMPKHIFKKLIYETKNINNMRVNIFGFTFKPDCTDFRNTKVLDLYKFFKKNKSQVDVYDPLINKKELFNSHKIVNNNYKSLQKSNILILAVSHKKFIEKKMIYFCSKMKKNSLIFDINGCLDRFYFEKRGFKYLTL